MSVGHTEVDRSPERRPVIAEARRSCDERQS